MPEAYDETRDLATLLHAAVRQGSWSPAARGAVDRLQQQLGVTGACLASEVAETLQHREMARRMQVRVLQHEIPVSLAAAARADIEAMGNDVPLALKRLWGYLLPAEVPDDAS